MSLKKWVILVVISIIVVPLVACSPKVATPEEGSQVATQVGESTEGTEAVSEKPAARTDEVTFEVWYLSQSPEDIQLIEELSQEFAVSHPGVKLELSAYGWDEMNTNFKLALDSGTGPDVAYASPGANGHVIYAQAGHLVDLTDAYHSRGWDQKFDEDFVMSWQRQLGGKIYGIPYEANVYGVFYNMDIFADLGLQPPTTWDELETLLATLKENGITPFATAGLDGWAFAHYWQNLVHATTPIEKIGSVMYNLDDVSYVDDPGFLQATQILKDWYDKGYFNEGFLGLSYADENDLFVTGQTAMVLTGSWINASYLQNADFEVGLFILPMANPDLPPHALINPNNVWVVSKYSDNPGLALEYLDFVLGEEVAKARWELGILSAYAFDTMPEPMSRLQADEYQAIQNVGGGYSFNANLPGSETFIFNILQQMVVDNMDPKDVVAAMEENRNELLAGLN